MNSENAEIAQLVRRIALTLSRELDCDEYAVLSSQFVEAALEGQGSVDQWALAGQHLEQCPVCAQEFAALFECAQMERDGTWPTIAQILERLAEHELNA